MAIVYNLFSEHFPPLLSPMHWAIGLMELSCCFLPLHMEAIISHYCRRRAVVCGQNGTNSVPFGVAKGYKKKGLLSNNNVRPFPDSVKLFLFPLTLNGVMYVFWCMGGIQGSQTACSVANTHRPLWNGMLMRMMGRDSDPTQERATKPRISHWLAFPHPKWSLFQTLHATKALKGIRSTHLVGLSDRLEQPG